MEQIQVEIGVKISETHCSKCTVCSSVCPYDAISTEETTGEVRLSVEKCQVCGICFSACPASAIETVYYDIDSLTNYVQQSMQKTGLKTLVVACRSNSPLQNETMNMLRKWGADDFILLRLPCVGRLSPSFFLKALTWGITRLAVVPCEEEYCRFKEGSRVSARRFLAMQNLLDQFGFRKDAFILIKKLKKVHIDTNRCIGCGDCVYVCPYNAIKIVTPGVAQIDLNACSGCGVCAAVCPAIAISPEGFEYESMSRSISDYNSLIHKMKLEGKTPIVLVFCCQWSEFSALDNNQDGMVRENVVLFEVPCSGRVDSLHILEAFCTGFEGVLLVACKDDECKFEKGNEKAKERILSIKKLLAQVNLENRLEICFTSPKNLGEFDTYINSFVEKISSLSKRS